MTRSVYSTGAVCLFLAVCSLIFVIPACAVEKSFDIRQAVEFARQNNITKIIAGKPARSRWFEVLRGTVIDQIIRNSGQIDVYVVSEGTGVPEQTRYFPEASSINLRRSIVYGFGILGVLLRYWLHRVGLMHFQKFEPRTE